MWEGTEETFHEMDCGRVHEDKGAVYRGKKGIECFQLDSYRTEDRPDALSSKRYSSMKGMDIVVSGC